ncbi:hypothetical protein [Nostoc sp. DedQUE07]|uniref:hypothetical protein n=1 Tax=Nostoc sp. DedQUE07 TaxID=3075392 RepID=UPI002AD4AAB1|nr:hypothetical protein [Nostoc sp. DedQUE07]MDZ8131884.1 hypothetical protein [Nostoc sp. DedQUE07]
MNKIPKSSAVLLLLLISCQPSPPTTPQAPIAIQPPSPEPKQVLQQPATPDPFEEAISRGSSAATIAQTSTSLEDRKLVQAQWQEAIALMKAVPKTSPNYATAQTKITEYQSNLSGVSKQRSVAVAAAPKSITKPSANTKVVSATPVAQPAQSQLESYFNSVIDQGGDGDSYWCEEYKSLQKTLYSPRSYKILSSEKRGTEKQPAFKFHTTVESSNKGGSPIVVNWNFYLVENGNSWCIANMDS